MTANNNTGSAITYAGIEKSSGKKAGDIKGTNEKANKNGKAGFRYRANGKIIMIPPEDILPNPNQPRRVFNEDKLQELAQSIKENGMIHPITVLFKGEKPILVAGERRLRAAKLMGSKEIACIAVRAEDSEAALLTLVENLQREDMNCFEEAEGIHKLIKLYGLTQEEAARRLGSAQSTVANRLRLLRLSGEERENIILAGLTERHARALLKIEDIELRKAALARIIRDRLNVSQSERLIADWLRGRIKRKPSTMLIRDVRLFVNTVEKAISTMKQSGIDAVTEKSETENYIEYVIKIPKKDAVVSKKLQNEAEILTTA